MAERHRGVLSLVEHGWRGARECSLQLSQHHIPVTHLVKGHLSREVLAMIRPDPNIRIIGIPRVLFRMWLWRFVGPGTMRGRIGWLLIDHQRTLSDVTWWCRRFRITPVLIRELPHGFELSVDGNTVSMADVFGQTTNLPSQSS